MSLPMALLWFTRDHGLWSAGFICGLVVMAAMLRWERVGWSVLFTGLGAALLALAAHFLRWWR